MLYLLIIFISFILLHKSLPLKPLPPRANEMRLLSFWFWKDFPFSSLVKFLKNSLAGIFTLFSSRMSVNKGSLISKAEISELDGGMSVLDLPELVLECIFERLSPEGLCNMATVCSSLRDRCTSDHLWKRHMEKKWGRLIKAAARREWQWHIASRKDSGFCQAGKQRGLIDRIFNLWPLSLVGSDFNKNNKRNNSPSVDSVLSWYVALESGKFWFPAQVYNRENGHVGFMLSCYDAELCYDSRTDTFQARYPPHGRRAAAIESGVTWDRLRPPPMDTSPHDLHISDCLNELRPGDHVEIQWRRNKEFPYGWWYGVVGHLNTCDRNDNFCHCHDSETVILEFNQYTPGSRWRQTIINKRDHREEGNEADGFYGGIHKLCDKDIISMWQSLWPTGVLE